MFWVSIVPPAASPGAEAAFAEGLADCYRAFGVHKAVTVLSEPQRKTVMHVMVHDDTGGVVGGARIHRAGRGSPLPALRALTSQPRLRAALIGDAARTGPPMELAALWVTRANKGVRGIGRLVAQASVAAAACKGATRAVTFSHHTIEPLLHGIGMRPVAGTEPIAYPSPLYRSTVYEVDPQAPVFAAPADRAQMSAMEGTATT